MKKLDKRVIPVLGGMEKKESGEISSCYSAWYAT
jgi:hypothetical protein